MAEFNRAAASIALWRSAFRLVLAFVRMIALLAWLIIQEPSPLRPTCCHTFQLQCWVIVTGFVAAQLLGSEYAKQPNPSLNADARRRGLRPVAGRRLACFVRLPNTC